MEIEYSLTAEDLAAFIRYHSKKGPRPAGNIRVKLPSIVWVVVLLIVIAVIANDAIRRLTTSFVLGVAVGGGAMIVLLVWTRKATLNAVKNLYEDEHARWVFSRRRLSICPAGVISSNEYHETIHRWSIVWRIDTEGVYAFFYTSLNEGIVIPRRAFRDEQHFEEFLALARRYQQGVDEPATKSTGIITSLPPEATAITRPDAP
jgi:hypothetical protein